MHRELQKTEHTLHVTSKVKDQLSSWLPVHFALVRPGRDRSFPNFSLRILRYSIMTAGDGVTVEIPNHMRLTGKSRT